MPTKPKTTIAAAEKKTIRAELTALKKERRKTLANEKAACARLHRERVRVGKLLDNVSRNTTRDTLRIDRRISILQGRL